MSAEEQAARARIIAQLRDERTAWQVTAGSDAWRYNLNVARRMDQSAQAVWRIACELADWLEKHPD